MVQYAVSHTYMNAHYLGVLWSKAFCGHGPIYPDSLWTEFPKVKKKFIKDENVNECVSTSQIFIVYGKSKYVLMWLNV